MTVEDVAKKYKSEIVASDAGRRVLRGWLSDRLGYPVSEYFARKVLEMVRNGAPKWNQEVSSLEDRLRQIYGICDPSWVPVSIWGEPDAPRAKWQRQFDDDSEDKINELVREFEYNKIYSAVDLAWDEPLMVLSIRDSHFGLFTDHPGPYHTYDLEEAAREYRSAAESFLRTARNGGIKHIVLPVGSDLLHFDGPDNATTRGTVQDVSTAWWRAFEAAVDSVNHVISSALDFDSVMVVLEPGNHDYNMAKALGIALRSKWDKENVVVLAGPESMKLVRHGGTRLFFHHGDTMKPEAYLGLLMSDYRNDLYDAKYIEVLTGHLHHRRKNVLGYPGDYQEDAGVVYRVTPALCPSSNWAEASGYRSVPGAQATVYTENGFYAMFEYRPMLSKQE